MRTRAQHPPGPRVRVLKLYTHVFRPSLSGISSLYVIRAYRCIVAAACRVVAPHARIDHYKSVASHAFPPTRSSASERVSIIPIFIATGGFFGASTGARRLIHIVIAGHASAATPIATPLCEHKRFHGALVGAFEAVPLHG